MHVWDVGGVRTQTRTYTPRDVHQRHRDAQSRISIILRGHVAEDADWGAARLGPGDVLFKSRDVSHEDRFAGEGAAIFSVLFTGGDDCPFRRARLEGAWRVRKDAASLRTSVVLLESVAARDATGFGAALGDLIASSGPSGARSSPPVWLKNIHNELEDLSLSEVDVAERARRAGYHPVTASREFRRSFGVSITEHASIQCVRRALALMSTEGLDLAKIAAGAGFYDQSHMNRTFLRVLGRAPGAYRRTVRQTEK